MLAGAAALVVATLGVASCTSVLGVDDFDKASDAICGVLDGCYVKGAPGGCRAHVDTIRDAKADAARTWLEKIGKGCTDNCASARSCLDVEPVCIAQADQHCNVKEDCCGFSTGGSDCGADGACCVTAGHHCTADDDCCPGAGVCNPTTHTCGGTQCRDEGAPCDIGEQCCSGHCRDRACSKAICDEDGFPCTSDGSCCSGYCASGRCGRPKECALLLAPCMADADCCAVDGSHKAGFCYRPAGASFGLCSTATTCGPLEADCSSDAQCCTKHCDATYHKCGEACRVAQAACSSDGECCSGHCEAGQCDSACSTAYCTTDADCCPDPSQPKAVRSCIAGTCAPACKPTTCDHKVCETGGPLSADCANSACIAAVCALDPFCCCNTWDSFCVAEMAKTLSNPAACLGACP